MGAEELDLHTRQLGRRIAHLASLAWRRIDDALAPTPRKGTFTRVRPGGPAARRRRRGARREVIVTRDADPAADPELALRAAAAAAREGLPISPGSAARLARDDGRAARAVAADGPASSRRPADGRARAVAGVGRARLRRRRRPAAARVGRDPAAWLVVAGPPVHRRPAQPRDVRAGRRRSSATSRVPTCWPSRRCCTTSARASTGDHSEVGEPMAVAIATRWGFDAGRRRGDRPAGALAPAAADHRDAARHRGPVDRRQRRRDRPDRGLPRPARGADGLRCPGDRRRRPGRRGDAD